MNTALIIPFMIGVIGILQGTINRQMSTEVGLATALVFGNIITLVVSIVFYYYVKLNPASFPEFVLPKAMFTNFQWWYILPALFGFFILAGLPVAIFKLGAVKVTLFLIAAQVLTSALWDHFVENIEVTPYKIVGLILAMMSVAISSFR